MASRMEVLAICIDRGGYRRGSRVAQLILEWELCVRSNGGPVGVAEFAAWWKDSDRTAYRRLAEFREMFPELGEHATPQDLMAPLLERLRQGQDVDVDVGLVIPA